MLTRDDIEALNSQSNIKLARADGCSELEDVRKKMIEQEKTFIETLKDLEKDLEECEDKEGKCKQELRDKEAEINNLKSKIAECENRVSNKQNQIEKLKDAEILAKECKGQLQVKEQDISSKEAEINNLKSKIAECENRVSNKQNQIEKLKDAEILAKECKGQLQVKEQDISAKEAEIKNLKDIMKECESKNFNSGLENKLSECNKKMEDLLKDREKALKGKEDDAAKKKADDDAANKEAGTIMPEEITLDHTEAINCGSYGGYYKNYSHVGRSGFYTSDVLKTLHPEMFANPKIAPHIEKGAHGQYGAVNYIFDFTSPINFSWGSPSNMLCYKCTDTGAQNHPFCQNNDTKSVCYPAGYYATPLYNNNFFDKICPNIVSESTQGDIKVKEVAPLILVNSAGQMIDKDGNNTQVYYSYLKPYLKPNGKIKDCAGDTKCKEFAEIMKKVAWETDKEVTLQTSALKGEASSYSSNNHIETQDSYTPLDYLSVA